MDEQGRIYVSENPKPEDKDRLARLVEMTLDEQLEEWRKTIAARRAEFEPLVAEEGDL